MRSIHLEDGLRISFPGEGVTFSAGVEIGMLATLMSLGLREFVRQIGSDNVEAARVLSQKFGYHLADFEDIASGETRVTFRNRAHRPKLKLVTSKA